MHKITNSWLPRVCLLVLAGLLIEGTLNAQFRGAARQRGPAAQQAAGPRIYRSRNFMMKSDLSPEDAKKLLKKLETMLAIISKYWGQPNRKPIECYIVEDLNNWPQDAFPADAYAKLAEGAGKTTTLTSTLNGRPVNAKAIVYAMADRGTPLHEAVHAYCGQNFGHTGPTWYSEGMAELGSYWVLGDTSVELPEVVLRYLQESEPKPLLAIVDNTDQTGDSWQNYAWRWALCHLLSKNGNYAKRFRPLGLSLLQQNRGASFTRTYGAMSREIAFEYRFFIEHLQNGLRADLIAWDWSEKFIFPRGNRPITSEIKARGGWQPSRIKVEAGTTYQVTAEGQWQVERNGDELSADGEVVAKASQETEDARDADADQDQDEVKDKKRTPPPEGAGRMLGVILDPTTMTLGEPFELGTKSRFTAKTDGQLYLRCKDGWGVLEDNQGKMEVAVSVGG